MRVALAGSRAALVTLCALAGSVAGAGVAWGAAESSAVPGAPVAETAAPTAPGLALPRLDAVNGMGRGRGPGISPEVGRALAIMSARRLLPDDSGDTKEIEGFTPKVSLRGKVKDCCGYPLGEPRTYKMTFYWVAWEAEYASEPADVELYTRDGFLIGRFPRTFVFELKLEGSGVLRDGRVLNYDGQCSYGIGVCFSQLDGRTHPLGKGGQGRPLVPFRSVAVDLHWVPLGTPLYLPELRGLLLPDGTRHDGCVRADDTGGNIRRRELDLFVESYATWKFFEDQFWNDNHVTPLIEEPRCAYLRREQPGSDPSVDRRSEATDWNAIHQNRTLTTRRDPVTGRGPQAKAKAGAPSKDKGGKGKSGKPGKSSGLKSGKRYAHMKKR